MYKSHSASMAGLFTMPLQIGEHSVGRPDDHEALIASLGQDLIQAYASGDKPAAQRYQRAMYQAIAQRAPIKQAQRFAEIDRAIAVSAGCYFVERCDADRLAMGGAS